MSVWVSAKFGNVRLLMVAVTPLSFMAVAPSTAVQLDYATLSPFVSVGPACILE